jgi:hypothetical protein
LTNMTLVHDSVRDVKKMMKYIKFVHNSNVVIINIVHPLSTM